MYFGNTPIDDMKVGNDQVDSAYIGSTLVWSSGGYNTGSGVSEFTSTTLYTTGFKSTDCVVMMASNDGSPFGTTSNFTRSAAIGQLTTWYDASYGSEYNSKSFTAAQDSSVAWAAFSRYTFSQASSVLNYTSTTGSGWKTPGAWSVNKGDIIVGMLSFNYEAFSGTPYLSSDFTEIFGWSPGIQSTYGPGIDFGYYVVPAAGSYSPEFYWVGGVTELKGTCQFFRLTKV